MRRYFITGTSTDCGKTFVTARLLHHFKKSKAIKPIASGCQEIDGVLVSSDALELQKTRDLPLETINPWTFKTAVSPHIAAEIAGITVTTAHLVDYCLNLELSETEILFIEGAGGLIVPINEKDTWVDFLQQTGIPVIMVVGMQLGCINHALLTEIALRVNTIHCSGWIANCIDPDMLALEQNIMTLKNKLALPFLAKIHHQGYIEDYLLSSL